ncbi:Charged multivesicular body protein 1b [Thelohanellus kitauei]|uniref:Charged multivesicular body protein 1b n=1 Tax=Thelohanellus kitauei TaxID=669202 RepID=A0A0C2N9A5_THEKT|nr:Charged multivesicular body protein 1b [Thelohanellus kitauei]
MANKVEMAVSTKQLSSSIEGVVNSVSSAMKSMDLEKLTTLMSQFEKQFETLDVQSNVMQESISTSTAVSVPIESVDSVLRKIADENNLELKMELPTAGSSIQAKTAEAQTPDDESMLLERLAKLRQP